MKEVVLAMIALALLAACSPEEADSTPAGNHVWKGQTDALQHARDIGLRAQDAEARKRQALEDAQR